MAFQIKSMNFLCTILFIVSLLSSLASAQLSANFYATSCPNVQTLVRTATNQAVSNQPRQGASILRLFFHDCFVNVSYLSYELSIIYETIGIHRSRTLYILLINLWC